MRELSGPLIKRHDAFFDLPLMLLISAHQRYFVYGPPTDMRKGFDSLCGLVRSGMNANPMSGDMFIFFNRPKTHIKILCWERDGFAVYCKRLERGVIEVPGPAQDGSIHISAHILALILQGIVLSSVKRKKRFVEAA